MADLKCFFIVRQPSLDLAQVDILLAQIFEVVAAQNLVVAIIQRPGYGKLLFLQGSLKCGDRLLVVTQLVVKVTQGVPAPTERPVMPRLFRMRLGELFKNIDRLLKRGKRLVILMGLVLDIGNDLISFAEVLSKLGDRWVRGSELEPELE